MHKNHNSATLISWYIALCKFHFEFPNYTSYQPDNKYNDWTHAEVQDMRTIVFGLIALPWFPYEFLSGPFFQSLQAINLKLSTMIEHIKEKSSE